MMLRCKIHILLCICCFVFTHSIGHSQEFFPNIYSASSKYEEQIVHIDDQFNRVIKVRQSSFLENGNSQIQIVNKFSQNSGASLSFPFLIFDIIPIQEKRFLISVNEHTPRILLIDISGNIISNVELPLSSNRQQSKFIGSNKSMAFIEIADNIFGISMKNDSLAAKLLADQVLSVEHSRYGFNCIRKSGGGHVLRSVDLSGNIQREIPFSPLGISYKIISTKHAILVLASSTGISTNAFLLDVKTGKQEMMFFPGTIPTVTMWEKDSLPMISWISEQSNGQRFITIKKYDNTTNTVQIPDYFVRTLSAHCDGSMLQYIFDNGFCMTNVQALAIESASRIGSLHSFIGQEPVFTEFNDEKIIHSRNGYLLLTMIEDPFWWVRRFANSSGKYLFFIIGLLIVSLFYRHYTRQKRFLEAGLELSGMGLILYLDNEGRLSKLNSTAKLVLQLSADVPLHRPIRYYVNKSSMSELLEFFQEGFQSRKPMQSRISIDEGDTIKEYIWSSTPLFGFAGSFAGCIFSGIDITAELEKKRLTNWAQLAHDMQTNLSIILLNAQQLQIIDEKNVQRQKKILGQINLVMQRVRDIVTVGREEEAQLSLHDAMVLCRNVIQEFDELLYPHARLSFSGKQVMFLCDPIKLTRGLRNAVENGIRALQKQEGTVELQCTFDDNYVYFRIKDSGVGMDEFTKDNMMKPYFTTKRSHGGYGIGTMVMQKVAELHNGRIDIVSEPGKGTIITFIIPKILPDQSSAE